MKKLLTGVAIGYSTGAVISFAAVLPEILAPGMRPSRKSPFKVQAEDVALIAAAMVFWPWVFHRAMAELP